MTNRALASVMVLSAGCGDATRAPDATDQSPQIVYLVQNQLFGIRADGTNRRSFGAVGDDRERAGYPRLLPDGRISVLGDRVGRVFPYTTVGDRTFDRVGDDGVSLGDGACGVTLHGEARLVYFATDLYEGGAMTSTGFLVATDGGAPVPFGSLDGAGLFGPSPDGDGHLLVLHSPLAGDDEIWRVDLARGQDGLDDPEIVARIPFPRVALSPSRLTDGRIAYVQFDLRSPDHIGEIWLVEHGTTRPTGILGVDDAIAVGDRVVYEASGGDHISDLLVTDLAHPAYNITNTPSLAEHLGWSAADRVAFDNR